MAGVAWDGLPKQVGVDDEAFVLWFPPLSASAAVRMETEAAHHSLGSFLVHVQSQSHPAVPIAGVLG